MQQHQDHLSIALGGVALPKPMMSSREIADLTGSTHDNVLKTIRRLTAEGVVSPNETPYVHPQNGQTYTELLLDFRDTLVVVSGYSVMLRTKIIDRWQELEQEARDPSQFLQKPAALRGILLHYCEKVIALQDQVEELAPKAIALDRIATPSDGSMSITETAKALQKPPQETFRELHAMKWIYRRAGSSTWLAYEDKIRTGYLEHKVTTIEREDQPDKTVTQVRVTAKGLVKLAKVFGLALPANNGAWA